MSGWNEGKRAGRVNQGRGFIYRWKSGGESGTYQKNQGLLYPVMVGSPLEKTVVFDKNGVEIGFL